MSVSPAANVAFEIEVPVAIVGAGACGLIAALAAGEAGIEALVLEGDPLPSGSTALSAGLIPAAGTRFQAEKGIADGPELLVSDIQAKTKGGADAAVAAAVAEQSGPAIEWLADAHAVPFELVEGFVYPGHSVLRMHGTPTRTGAELMGALTQAAAKAGIDLMTDASVARLFADDDGRIAGIEVARPNGATERIGCRALILACNGYGGDPDLVRRHIPEMADALYFGHPSNRGDAVRWGEALGADIRHMTAYQGHGSVAHPHGVLITWAVLTEGGIQVNADGQRFANETTGYSEQAVPVLAQPGGIAWSVYAAPQHEVAQQFEDYRDAEAMGALKTADSVAELERAIEVPRGRLAATLDGVARMARGAAADPLGREFDERSVLGPPYFAVKVTGALFHTQGGLVVDPTARVLRDGVPFPNLFAAGGAACGLSGPNVEGYLSGNGLLTAVTLGRIAGRAAAVLTA
jgi:fumarate reductase flavoprotein subunit